MKRNMLILAALACTISLWSCKKPAGRGGQNAIVGIVYYNLTDHNGKIVAKEKAVDVDVFITYADDSYYSDDATTDQDGQYIFRYMNKGEYTIHAYQDCGTCDSELSRVEVEVSVSGKKDEVIAPDIELVENVDPDDGSATITGRVYVKKYNIQNQVIGEYYGQDQEMYIVYDTDSTYFENTDTNGDGRYTFSKLIPGNYTIYTFSDCYNCGAQGTEIRQIAGTITVKGEKVALADLQIEER